MQAIVWIAAVAATALAARGDRDEGDRRAAQTAGLALTAAMCGMLALAIVWRSGHAAPLRPTAGNIGTPERAGSSRGR